MPFIFRFLSASTVLVSGCLGFSAVAAALENPQPPATPPAAIQADDQIVQKFAVARAEVQDLQLEYIEKIRSAREPEVATLLQREAQAEIIKTVETKGLSVNQYNSLSQKMHNDPEFRQRVERAMPKQAAPPPLP